MCFSIAEKGEKGNGGKFLPRGLYNLEEYAIIYKQSVTGGGIFGAIAQLGERTERIREVRGFDPLRVHHVGASE